MTGRPRAIDRLMIYTSDHDNSEYMIASLATNTGRLTECDVPAPHELQSDSPI
jgi:hypothetical protein